MSVAEILHAAPLDAPVYARPEGDGHYYWDSQPLPRVTKIVDMFTSGNLPEWAAKMAAEECADIIAKYQNGEISREDADHMIMMWPDRMTAAIRYRDFKGAIGSISHRATHEKVLGLHQDADLIVYLARLAREMGYADPEKDEPGRPPYAEYLAKQARHYVHSHWAWLEEAKPRFLAVGHEAMVVSLTHGYAGTEDAIAEFDTRYLRKVLKADFPPQWSGKETVCLSCDWKTSNQLHVKKVMMQIEAYRRADFIALRLDGSRHDVPATDGGLALHIPPMGECKVVAWAADDEHFEAFLSLRHAWGVLHGLPKPNHKTRAAAKTAKRDQRCPF